MNRPSGLNAIRVIVNVCPASGGRICCHVVVSYSLMTACSAVVALQAVAIISPEGEAATVMSYALHESTSKDSFGVPTSYPWP